MSDNAFVGRCANCGDSLTYGHRCSGDLVIDPAELAELRVKAEYGEALMWLEKVGGRTEYRAVWKSALEDQWHFSESDKVQESWTTQGIHRNFTGKTLLEAVNAARKEQGS